MDVNAKMERAVDSLIEYYAYNRQSGHTTAMLLGAKNVPCVVVMPNSTIANDLSRHQKINAVGISFVETGQMRGRKEPMILDHETVRSMLHYLRARAQTLEGEKLLFQKEVQKRDEEIDALLQRQIDMALKMAEDARRIQRNR